MIWICPSCSQMHETEDHVQASMCVPCCRWREQVRTKLDPGRDTLAHRRELAGVEAKATPPRVVFIGEISGRSAIPVEDASGVERLVSADGEEMN